MESEKTIIFHAFDPVIILASERFVDVVGIGCVERPLDLVGVGLALCDDLTARVLVLLHHLDGKDVVDFDVMGRKAIVQEVGREHHVVASVPELRIVLGIEKQNVARADEPEPTENHHATEKVHEQTREVQRPVLHAHEAREYGTHHTKLLVDHHPEIVCYAESSKHCVRTVLARTHFDSASNPTDEA